MNKIFIKFKLFPIYELVSLEKEMLFFWRKNAHIIYLQKIYENEKDSCKWIDYLITHE